jgi:hypothetical protein
MSGTLVGAPTVPFVAGLRSRPGIVRIGGDAGPRIVVRVEHPERWDVIAFDVPAGTPAIALKREAMARLGLKDQAPEDFIFKLRGFKVLDEEASLADGGARDGSTYILTYRCRRPVR